MSPGIDGMGGLRIGRELQSLGIGMIGMVMMKMTILDVEGERVTVRDREVKNAGEIRLVIRVIQNMIYHLRSDVQPIVVEAPHHDQGRLLEMKIHIDRMMNQELLHTEAEAERIVTNGLVLPAVLPLLIRGENDTALRNMHWMISVMNLRQCDRGQQPQAQNVNKKKDSPQHRRQVNPIRRLEEIMNFPVKISNLFHLLQGTVHLSLEFHLALPVLVPDLNHPYNFIPRWIDTLKSLMTLDLTLPL